MGFYILSIPNKASVYPEYMPDTIERKETTSKTDLLMKYLQVNKDLNVVDVKPTFVKAKKRKSQFIIRVIHTLIRLVHL